MAETSSSLLFIWSVVLIPYVGGLNYSQRTIARHLINLIPEFLHVRVYVTNDLLYTRIPEPRRSESECDLVGESRDERSESERTRRGFGPAHENHQTP